MLKERSQNLHLQETSMSLENNREIHELLVMNKTVLH